MNLSHSELCERAARWLKNTFNCRCVVIEPKALTYANEFPDVVGWVGGRCILIECKTSRSDFYADQKKLSRQDKYFLDSALGNWRFYFAEPGIIPTDKIPEGWGLYEIKGRTVRHATGAKYANALQGKFSSNAHSEVAVLLYHIDKLKEKESEAVSSLLERAKSAESLLATVENKAAEYKVWAAKAVKENEELRAKVAELEAENKKLKKENDELEAEATANFI